MTSKHDGTRTAEDLLSASVTRKEEHLRRFEFHGFSRSDGLFEVEGRIRDSKTSVFHPPNADHALPPNQAFHDFTVRVVFGMDMVIQAVGVTIGAFPYTDCQHGGDVLQSLVGLKIGAGWNTAVRKRLPSGETCAHIKEMMGPLASAAFQLMHPWREHLIEAVDEQGRPVKIDSCYAYGVSRQIVLKRWPEFHRPRGEGVDSA